MTCIYNQFIEKVRDCFLTQHITDITRFRGSSIGNTLDLLFSNDDTIIEKYWLRDHSAFLQSKIGGGVCISQTC